jgi:hypothetical protein
MFGAMYGAEFSSIIFKRYDRRKAAPCQPEKLIDFRDAGNSKPGVRVNPMRLRMISGALFLWFLYRLQWTGIAVTGGFIAISLIYDLVRGRERLKPILIMLAGTAVAWVACLGIGYVLLEMFSPPGLQYIGIGTEPWNLPGTIVGVVVFIASAVIAEREYRRNGS